MDPSEYRLGQFGSFVNLHCENIVEGLILSARTERASSPQSINPLGSPLIPPCALLPLLNLSTVFSPELQLGSIQTL